MNDEARMKNSAPGKNFAAISKPAIAARREIFSSFVIRHSSFAKRSRK
jgi:hypothetical protein